MENNKLFKAVERSTQDIPITLSTDNPRRLIIQSQKTKYVNGKMSEVTEVGYTASLNNSDYLLEEDKSNNEIKITAYTSGASGTCVLTQNESGNKINLQLTTSDYWEIHLNPIAIPGTENPGIFFTVDTNISGEDGSMVEGTLYTNWIVNQRRYMINIYISVHYPEIENRDILSWSCFDKKGAFNPNYGSPDNSYFTTRTTGLGSYTLTKVSTPSVSAGTLVYSGKFKPAKKYPLDLNFYWGAPT